MIDGLGITGYEGVFLRVCEITLSILRAHRETLVSVLETFIHDPLVEWTKSHKSSGVEVQNPHAQVLSSLINHLMREAQVLLSFVLVNSRNRTLFCSLKSLTVIIVWYDMVISVVSKCKE